ncbi:MAG TPA: hypothetical protein VJS68_00325 [Thermoplasmata archaeon]|nr:hypothetical protein [Thermoplasmata archaeon]
MLLRTPAPGIVDASAYDDHRLNRSPADLAGSEEGGFATSDTVCVWLSTPRTAPLLPIGQELTDLLSRRPMAVEFLHSDGGFEDRRNSGSVPYYAMVECLADAAGAMVRRGLTVVVACPLVDAQAVNRARQRVSSLVLVSLRPAEKAQAVERIPTIFRTVQNGRVIEREIPLPATDPADRPDIQVDGSLGPPVQSARSIADVLFRAGWLPLYPRSPSPPLRPTMEIHSVPMPIPTLHTYPVRPDR